MFTHKGRYIDERNADMCRDFDIEEVAHNLAFSTRYNGAFGAYSIATHCLAGSYYAPRGYKLAFLLHDSIEWLTGDIITNIKRLFPGIEEYEQGHLDTIMGMHGVNPDWRDMVTPVDLGMFCAEYERFTGQQHALHYQYGRQIHDNWWYHFPTFGEPARDAYLRRYHELMAWPEERPYHVTSMVAA